MMATKRKSIRRMLAYLIFCTTMLSMAVIGPQSGYAAQSTTFSNSGGIITLANTLIELKWNSANGVLTGLKNKTTNTQHIGSALNANWTAFINMSTDTI